MGTEDEPTEPGEGESPPELTEERFAANLRMTREAIGVSQSTLAEEMAARGWPWRQQTVTRVETGQRMVRLGEAKAVAEILGTSLDKLTQPTGEMRIVEELSEWTHQARSAWLAIKESTVRLLNAKGLLRLHPAATDRKSASERVLEAVQDAAHVQQLTPEGAVAQGIAEIARSAAFFSDRARVDGSVTIQPRGIVDAGQIAVALRSGDVVVIDMTGTRAEEVQRIQDFVNGAVGVRGGSVERLGELRYRAIPALLNPRELGISTRSTPPSPYTAPVMAEYMKPSERSEPTAPDSSRYDRSAADYLARRGRQKRD